VLKYSDSLIVLEILTNQWVLLITLLVLIFWMRRFRCFLWRLKV
jgi:hypothetical protein